MAAGQVLTAAEKDWLRKYHEACSACRFGVDLKAVEEQHAPTWIKRGEPMRQAAYDITLAHALRIAGKSSPAEADDAFKRTVA